MGQYYKLVNFDKREFVEPWPLDCSTIFLMLMTSIQILEKR